MNVVTVVGTRPEIIRLSRIIPKLDQFFNHILVHTGQNYDYELNEIFFKDLELRQPDYFLNAAGKNSAETIGKVIIEIDKILAAVKPDAMLILGDTNSCMAVIPAKRRKIPIFHMEAGNRCFDMRVPEEINRRIVDHTADINLTYSTIARNYLLNEGIMPDTVIKTGSPMFEVLNYYKKGIKNSKILKKLNLKKKKYFLISTHREENVDEQKNLTKIVNILNKLSTTEKLPLIVSTHPRTKKRLSELNKAFHNNIIFHKPMGFLDYNNLQINAYAVLSDSGTINEEASILNFPALNIRENHERPEAMEEATSIMVGLEVDLIFQALQILKEQNRQKERTLNLVYDYNVPNVSEKIVRIIYSYTNYISRKVWKQYQ